MYNDLSSNNELIQESSEGNNLLKLENIEHDNCRSSRTPNSIRAEKIGKFIIMFFVMLTLLLFAPFLWGGIRSLSYLVQINMNMIKLHAMKVLFVSTNIILLLIFVILWLRTFFDNNLRYIYTNNRFEYRMIFTLNILFNLSILLVTILYFNVLDSSRVSDVYSDPGKIVGFGSIYAFSIISLIFVIKRNSVVHLTDIMDELVSYFKFEKYGEKVNDKIERALNYKNMMYMFSRKGSGKSKYFIDKFDFTRVDNKLDLTKSQKKKLQKQFIHISCSDLMHTDEDLYVKLWNKLINVNTVQSIFKSRLGMEFKFNKSSNAFSKLANKIIVIDDLELLYDNTYWKQDDEKLCAEQKQVINKFFGFFKLIEDYFENESNKDFKPIIILTGASNPMESLHSEDKDFFDNKLGDISIHERDIIELPLFRINMNELINNDKENKYEYIRKLKWFWDSNNLHPELWKNMHNIRHWKTFVAEKKYLLQEILNKLIINDIGSEPLDFSRWEIGKYREATTDKEKNRMYYFNHKTNWIYKHMNRGNFQSMRLTKFELKKILIIKIISWEKILDWCKWSINIFEPDKEILQYGDILSSNVNKNNFVIDDNFSLIVATMYNNEVKFFSGIEEVFMLKYFTYGIEESIDYNDESVTSYDHEFEISHTELEPQIKRIIEKIKIELIYSFRMKTYSAEKLIEIDYDQEKYSIDDKVNLIISESNKIINSEYSLDRLSSINFEIYVKSGNKRSNDILRLIYRYAVIFELELNEYYKLFKRAQTEINDFEVEVPHEIINELYENRHLLN